MTKPRFLSIGDAGHDVFLQMNPENAHLHMFHHEAQQICFTYADKIPVQALHETVAGNSANAAVGLARLGFETAFYTHLGGDNVGEWIKKTLIKEGVAPDYIVIDEQLTSNYSTVINLNAERTILIYHVHRHYHLPKLDQFDWLYLSSMADGFAVILPDLLEYIQKTGAKLVYQPGTFQLHYGSEAAATLLKASEVLIVNKEEAELYLGEKPSDDFVALLKALLELGPKIAVITDGPKGAYASDGQETLFLDIIKEAPRIEATGAGDAFSTGLIAALATGESLAEALRWGQAESSSVIQQIGPQAGLLHMDSLKKLLVEYPDLQAKPLK